MQIEITRTGNSVAIKDVEAPDSHTNLDFTGDAGSFDTVLSSATGGTDPNDTLTITHDTHGTIGTFTAADFQSPSGADLATVRPFVEALLTI